MADSFYDNTMSDHSDDEDHSASDHESNGSTTDDSDTSIDTDNESDDSDNDDDIQGTSDVWSNILGEDEGPSAIPFRGVSGAKSAPPPDAEPISYLDLFLTNELLTLIVTETNRYAAQWIKRHSDYLAQNPNSRIHCWIREGNTTINEIRAFIGIIFNMGIMRKPTIESYWEVNTFISTPWFPAHFNGVRFKLLLKFLHFSNNGNTPQPCHPDYRIYKIQSFAYILNGSFMQHFHPYQNILIDENVLGYRRIEPHLRHLVSQRDYVKFRIKVWCVNDSKTGYCSHFEVCKNSHDFADTKSTEKDNLVFRLLTNAKLLDNGHHLGINKYFTSPKLLSDLFHRQTSATGTVRSKSKGLPKPVIMARKGNHEVVECRKGPLLCVSYIKNDSKRILLSTMAKGGFENVTNARGIQVKTPKIANVYKNCVQQRDFELYIDLSDRCKMKWTTRVAFLLLWKAALNAYRVYEGNTNHTKKMDIYDFTISVVESLVQDYSPTQLSRKRKSELQIETTHVPPSPSSSAQSASHDVQSAEWQCNLTKLPGGEKRNCVNNHAQRVMSEWICVFCNVGLCPDCFIPYHKNKCPRLSSGGFLYVDDILQNQKFQNFSVADVQKVVDDNDKQRFALEEDVESGRLKIRANQGHSMQVEDLDLVPVTEHEKFPTVIHGTNMQSFQFISRQGLSRMNRNHIHFAAGEPGENGVISGMRQSCSVIIYIKLEKALQDGIRFFQSANGVILCPGNENGFLSTSYFEKVLDRTTRQKIPFGSDKSPNQSDQSSTTDPDHSRVKMEEVACNVAMSAGSLADEFEDRKRKGKKKNKS